MWEQFWIQNSHYVVESFVAFLMLTAGWIYLDGWLIERKIKTLLRAIGFLVLMLWSSLDAAPVGIIEFGLLNAERLAAATGVIGFGFLFLSLLIDPVPVRPGERPVRFFSKLWESTFTLLPFGLPSFDSLDTLLRRVLHSLSGIVPVAATLASVFLALLSFGQVWMFVFATLTTFLLWIHYSRGIQSEWKFFYLGFLFITLSLGLGAGAPLADSSNVLIASLFAPYHTVWIAEHVVKFVGALMLGAWAWGFIRFRIFPQIFSSLMALSFIIFVLTTILYTGFILGRTQERAIQDLETNVRTLNFALGKIKESAILAARIASTNPQIREAVKRDDKEALFKNLNALMFENETDFMAALNPGAEVLMRAEDKEHFGDSIAEDPVVWRALDGKAAVTIAAEQSVTLPVVSIKAGSPIVDTAESGEPEIIGAVVTGYLLDLAFVDGVKKITNLDVMVFANDTAAATTFATSPNEIRFIGTKELDQDIVTMVLKKGQNFTGTAMILNQPFLAAYIPIKDIEETTIGMLFTGRSQASILALTADTMKRTFSVSLLLMLASVFPIWALARFITRHQQV